MSSTRKVLNVGGNNKDIPLPPQYAEFEHLLLDIDPAGAPDIVCDARELATLAPGQFDAVYCSHNLEHYYRHDVPRVLAGFIHVLKPGGFAQVRVPDIQEVMRIAVEKGLDVEESSTTRREARSRCSTSCMAGGSRSSAAARTFSRTKPVSPSGR